MGRGQFVRPILQQTSEEQVPCLEQRKVLLVLNVSGRQQASGFQVEQRGRDDQELGRLTKIERVPGGPQVGDEIICHLRERDLGDVELATSDQSEQQVEGTVKVGQMHRESSV